MIEPAVLATMVADRAVQADYESGLPVLYAALGVTPDDSPADVFTPGSQPPGVVWVWTLPRRLWWRNLDGSWSPQSDPSVRLDWAQLTAAAGVVRLSREISRNGILEWMESVL